MEDVVAGKTKSIGNEETKAIVAIQREYARRNLTIQAIFKENAWLDKQLETLDNENEEFTKTIIDQYEYNQSLNNLVSTLKSQLNEMEIKTKLRMTSMMTSKVFANNQIQMANENVINSPDFDA